MEPLAPYAMPDAATRGRRHPEPPHPFRTPYQRDRERIVHSSAFRRMTGKTQVLVATINDHHRTRLTHTLEVTQIARTVARRLRLNEDLTEAIALAHDIGHPPFGHAGEKTLDDCLKPWGGFDHNLFGLRRVDELEERYPEFPGLNLTAEVREAFVKHAGKLDAKEAVEFRDFGSTLIEAQVVDAVDSLAYDTHDVDDALGLGILTPNDLKDVEFWVRTADRVRRQYGQIPDDAFRRAVVRELLAWQANDLLDETARRIPGMGVRNLADVRTAPEPIVSTSVDVGRWKGELEQFLHARVYTHPDVLRMTANGDRVLRDLFAEYRQNPSQLPERHLRRWAGAAGVVGPPADPPLTGRNSVPDLEVVVGEYLAGMTDRFALREYRRLFQPGGDL